MRRLSVSSDAQSHHSKPRVCSGYESRSISGNGLADIGCSYRADQASATKEDACRRRYTPYAHHEDSAIGHKVHACYRRVCVHSCRFHQSDTDSAIISISLNVLGLFTPGKGTLVHPRADVLTMSCFPVFYMQLYAISHGVDRTLAFYTISILNGASVVWQFMDRISRYRLTSTL